MSSLSRSKLVTIFGGSGFLGRHTVRMLANAGYRIRVAVRRPELVGHLQPLGGVGQIHAVQANIGDDESVEHAVAGSDVVINLVGLLFQSGRQSFRRIHRDGPRIIGRAARDAKVRNIIHVSAIGADQQSESLYAKTKAMGEEALREEFPASIILRPSVVFGPEDDFFNRFAAMASMAPVLPRIGSGRNKMQPVYVGDVATAILNAVDGKARRGATYELGGPEVLEFKEILKKVFEFSGGKGVLVWIPTPVAKWLMAPILSLAPKPALTMDQIRLLQYDNVISEEAVAEGRTLEALGVPAARSIHGIVPQYLEQYRPKGQFSTIRLQ